MVSGVSVSTSGSDQEIYLILQDNSVVASIIRNLGMLRWLDVKPDAALPVSDDELVLA